VAAALYERICYDPDGQPVSTTLMDYLVPTAAEMCPVDVIHLQTPSAFSESGAKGMGEGGMIGAPATVLNAVNDALAGTGASFDHIPVLPEEVCAVLAGAGQAGTGGGLADGAPPDQRGGAAAGRGGGATGECRGKGRRVG
jgi:CO/xanthine dehydrogenase Mo-binding subunit